MHKRQTIKLAFAAVLPLLLCAIWLAWLQVQIAQQQERNQILETEISRIDPLIREIKDIEKWKSQLLTRMQTYSHLRPNKYSLIVTILKELSMRIPEGVSIKSVKYSTDGGFEEHELLLEGEAVTVAAISNFEQALETLSEGNSKNYSTIIEDISDITTKRFRIRLLHEAINRLTRQEADNTVEQEE